MWSGKQKAQEGEKKKPLLGIIAGNSFNGSRWKTPLNTGGNFANYCSMHLSNLILRLPPCIFLSLRRFFPLILHSWVVKWHMPTCYTPSLLKKNKKKNGVLIWSNNGFTAIYAISEMFQQQGTQMALFFCPYEDGFWVDIWDFTNESGFTFGFYFSTMQRWFWEFFVEWVQFWVGTTALNFCANYSYYYYEWYRLILI